MTEKEKRAKVSKIKGALKERFLKNGFTKRKRREIQCFEYRVDRYFSTFTYVSVSRRHGGIQLEGHTEIYVDGFDEMISEQCSMPYFAQSYIGMLPQIFPDVWGDGSFYAEFSDSADKIADEFVSVVSKIALPVLLAFCSFSGARQMLEAASRGEIIREVDVPDADIKLEFLNARQSEA